MQNPACALGLSQAEVELFDYFCYIRAHGLMYRQFMFSPCDKVALRLCHSGIIQAHYVSMDAMSRNTLTFGYTVPSVYYSKWCTWYMSNFRGRTPKTKAGRRHSMKYPNRFLVEHFEKEERQRQAA